MNNAVQVSPIVINHSMITNQITGMLQIAISSVMSGPISVVAGGISTRIISIQPYQFHEQPYPVGGRPVYYFTNRRYQLITNIPVTYNILDQRGTARIECELSLEVKTNAVGELVFVLTSFQGNLRDVAFGDIISFFVGSSLNDSINPLCNQDIITPLPDSVAFPAGTKLLSAQIDQPMAHSGNRNNLLLYVDPGT